MLAPSAGARILIADSDPRTRALYSASCLEAGCDVIEADEGRDALLKALVRSPALVVTELRLPLIDAVSLCQILRQDAATSAVPIIVVTPETSAADAGRLARAGADSVLAKNTATSDLLVEIHRLLAVSRELRTRAGNARSQAALRLAKSAEVLARSAEHARPMLSHIHQRFTTTTPPITPPTLLCPECDARLTYLHSQLGGVSARHAEQWDYYSCARHGRYQYRHRTRKLRQAPE